jgi:hypothetical protein
MKDEAALNKLGLGQEEESSWLRKYFSKALFERWAYSYGQ